LIADAYHIRKAPDEADSLIPPRRRPFPVLAPLWRNPDHADPSDDLNVPVAEIDLKTSFSLTDDMLSIGGLTQYAKCASFERPHPKRRGWAKRPITHAVKESEVQPLVSLFAELGPRLYTFLLERIKPPVQTYDKRSRMGAPVFAHDEHKLQVLRPFFAALLENDLSLFDLPNMWVINNIRLQPERVSKEREFVYVDKHNLPYLETVDEKKRWDEQYQRYCSRVRLVFNYPVANLLTQVLDSAIHDLFLSYPTFHHNMAAQAGRTLTGFALFIDCKHFERSVGGVVRHRCKLIGGLYARIMDRMLALPYLVPTDAGEVRLVQIAREKGYVEQMGSGVSCVAPLAKEILTLVYTDFLMQRRGYSFENALAAVLQGGYDKLTIWNYGDDNLLFGDEEEVMRCFDHMKQYLNVEVEEPRKFLGYEYSDTMGFFLSRSSYLLNFYLAERAPYSKFRPFPFLGRKLRKEVFARQGDPFIREELFKAEDERLTRLGYTPQLLAEAAEWEAKKAAASPTESNEKWILGKDYQLTDEEKAKDDKRYDVLWPDETKRIIDRLLSRE